MAQNASSEAELAQAQAYLQRLRDDEEFALREIITIKNKQGKPVPFERWAGQKKFAKHAARVNAAMKIRQQGFSLDRLVTHIKNARVAAFFDDMKNRQVDIYNKSDDDAAKLFEHVTFVDRHLPDGFQESRHEKSSSKAIHYKDSGWHIRIMTAGKTETASRAKGRGNTPQYLGVTEAGYIEHLGALVGSALGSLPDDGEITMESTSSGPRGWYSQYCLGIMQNGREIDDNVWAWDDRRFMFFGFLEHHEYYKPVPKDFQDEDEEEERLLELGADPGQIMWRRAKLDDYGRAQAKSGLPPLVQFKRDYPATWQDAFEEAGGAFFNRKIMVAVRTLVKETWPEPVVIGLKKAAGARPERILASPGNSFTIYKLPVPGWEGRYVFFADVGQGRPDGDFDVGYIGDLVNREVVAKYDGRLGADLNANNALLLCAYYFDAMLGMDMSGVGVEVRPYLLKSTYPKLWTRYKVENFHMEPEAVGVVWNKANRPAAVGRMRQAIEGREWTNPDADFYEESDFFGYHDPDSIKAEAATGFHDDHCMTQAGLMIIADTAPAPRQVVQVTPFQDVAKVSLQRHLRELRRQSKGDIGSRIAKGFTNGVRDG